MGYALTTLWHDRQRYIPGVLAVAFSALLITLQTGLLFGLLSVTSLPVDKTTAHLWVGSKDVLSVDLGRAIPYRFFSRLAEQPEVDQNSIERYYQGFGPWSKPNGGSELCMVVGSRLEPDSIGAVEVLTPEMREKLTLRNSIVVDKSELERLGVKGVGDTAEILNTKVTIVGLIEGYKSLAGPYVFCSLETAKPLLRLKDEETTYFVAKCADPAQAKAVAQRLRDLYGGTDMSAYERLDFSWRSQLHWLTKTSAGKVIGYTALLGLLVGAVVTSQTLYAATISSIREYAILRALGIPRWRMAAAVMQQSFWVGVSGVVVAIPTVYGMQYLAGFAGTSIVFPWWLIPITAGVTLVMAILSGLFALKSLKKVEPANLLR